MRIGSNQGDSLNLLLFITIKDEILKTFKQRTRGTVMVMVKVVHEDNLKSSVSFFADDIVPITDSKENL